MEISLITAFLVGAILSSVMLSMIVNVCRTYGIVDTPNWRKVHKVAVPRLGGLVFIPSLALSMSVGMALLDFYGVFYYEFGVSTFAMIGGTIAMYVVGLADDLQELSAIKKFGIQIIASFLFPLCNLMIDNLHGFCGIYEMPMLVSYLFTVFVILVIVNAVNLIDGIDGLSSGLSIIIMAILAVLYYQREMYLYTLMCVSMIATLFVFFLFNIFGKEGGSKVFMGDAGSLTLGYVIAYLVIKYQMTDFLPISGISENALLISYSLVLIPTFDVIRVALTRKMNGKPMFSPDKTHIHHKFMHAGLSMHMTLLMILVLQVVMFIINIALGMCDVNLTWIVLLNIAIYMIVNIILPSKPL